MGRLADAAAEAADRYGDRPAVVAPAGWAITYRDLAEAAAEVAAGMARTGVGPGDVVGLVLPASVEHVVAQVAADRIGAAVASVNPRLAAPERAACLRRVAPKLTVTTSSLLAGPETAKTIEIPMADRSDDVVAPLRRRPRGSLGAADEQHDDTRTSAIVFTSGTTGPPKGAVFTDAQIAAIADADTAGGASWGAATDVLVSTQMAHVGFMTKLAWQLTNGSTLHLLARWRPADALAAMARLRVPIVAGVSAQLALMVDHPDVARHDWGAVRGIVIGGGPVTPSLAERAEAVFGAPLSIRYSSTESGGVGTGTAFDAEPTQKLTTVGRPRGPVELSVRDDAGRPVPDGQSGEVWLRSPTACVGYYGDDEASRALIDPDGWLHTRDVGSIVADGPAAGCLRLTGRSDDVYIRGGYNVHPGEVEAVLADHPAVAAVAVAPRPHELLGVIGVAVVVPAGGHEPPTLEGLRGHAAPRLAAYKLPEALVIVDELPRTPMDKLDRAAVAHLASEGRS